MRTSFFGMLFCGFVLGCGAAEPELTPSNGLKVGMPQFKSTAGTSDSFRRLSLEVIIDGADAALKDELATSIRSNLDGSVNLKSVGAESEFTLRVVVSKENAEGFEHQDPIRIRLLVVDRSDDDPPRLSRLESTACMEGNFKCLRRQAQELCKMFVTDLDLVIGLVREMKES